jgi:hypothetical protein
MHWRDRLSRRFAGLAVFCIVLTVLLMVPVLFDLRVASVRGTAVVQLQGLPVSNLNTTMSFVTVQEAIDAPETLAGHVINVSRGTYRERISVSKPLSIIGQGSTTTVIDGFGGTVVQISSDNVRLGALVFGMEPLVSRSLILRT